MASRRLTAISVAQIKPRTKRFEVADAGCVGLYLQVMPSGAKRYAVRYRIAGKPAKFTLAAGLGLAAARTATSEIRQKVEQGIDPSQEKKAARTEAEIAAGATLRAVAEAYLRQQEVKPEGERLRTIGQRRATFERLIFPVLGGRPIHEIKRGEVIKLLDKVEIERGGRMADEVLNQLRVVFGWHAIRNEDFRSPLVRGMARTRPGSRMRSRTLTDDELRRVWRACDSMGAFGAFVQFMALTCTRRNEAARMTWDEVTGDDWLIPEARYKNKRPLLIPLSKAAQELLAKQPQIAACPYVFSSDGTRAVGGFGQGKDRLNRLSGVSGWRLHDVRRVCRSLLSRVGVANDVAEMCLGHTLPSLRRTYDLYDHYRERQRAFSALATEIERIVNPPPEGKVLKPRFGRSA
jgi:integrase